MSRSFYVLWDLGMTVSLLAVSGPQEAWLVVFLVAALSFFIGIAYRSKGK
jgi:hypothetical protein